MGYIEIKVIGVVSPKVITKYMKGIDNKNINENEKLLFCDFSEFDIQVGQVFDVVKSMDKQVHLNSMIRLKSVTQQFGKQFDIIPSGWKTICLFEFLSKGIPEIVKNLPVIDDWYDSHISVVFSSTSGK
jgi:hypothetical protein